MTSPLRIAAIARSADAAANAVPGPAMLAGRKACALTEGIDEDEGTHAAQDVGERRDELEHEERRLPNGVADVAQDDEVGLLRPASKELDVHGHRVRRHAAPQDAPRV